MVVLEANVTAPAPRFKLKLPLKVKLFMDIAGAGDNVIADAASIVVPEVMVNVPAEPPLPPKAAALAIVNWPVLKVIPPVVVLAPAKETAPVDEFTIVNKVEPLTTQLIVKLLVLEVPIVDEEPKTSDPAAGKEAAVDELLIKAPVTSQT